MTYGEKFIAEINRSTREGNSFFTKEIPANSTVETLLFGYGVTPNGKDNLDLSVQFMQERRDADEYKFAQAFRDLINQSLIEIKCKNS